MSSGARVSIPSSVRKMIQNIKEITGNHSEEEIYAMLKECSMDPNETAQKLLLQDTFHEVKRKRDRRKENSNNKESAESRWKPGMQGRGSRAGRGNYSPRYTPHDAAGGKNSSPGKENGINQVSEKGVGISSLPISQETKNKEITPNESTVTVMINGPTGVVSGNTGVVHAAHSSAGILVNKSEESCPPPLPPPLDAKENSTTDFGTGDTHGQLTASSSNSSASMNPAQLSGEYFSVSDPVLVPSQDSRIPGTAGTIKREMGSQRTPAEHISVIPAESKSTVEASEVQSSFMQGKMPSKSQRIIKNQLSESAQPTSSIHVGSSIIKPSSNYHGRSQQAIGPQKVGPSKEWKPKPTNPNPALGSQAACSSEVPTTVETSTESHSVLGVLDTKETTAKLHRKLDELHISDTQHVIIPNHIHVPEAEKLGFCFGSFDASFGLSTSYNNHPDTDKSPTPLSETSEGIEETVEQSSSNQNELATAEDGDYPDHPQSPTHLPGNLSSTEGNVSSRAVPEYSESKQETALPPGSNQYPVVHTSPNYSFGFMPPLLNSQLAPFENSETQARDGSRLPSFIVPQPLDPTSYYAQFYRSGADGEGRISPFHSPGVATKYNGNVAMLSSQSSPSPQEVGNMVLSSASPTPLATQPAGVMQNSIAVTQQPLPVFRQPTGVHIPHYPPNYIPYGHYFSPFYVPPPAIHHFLSNGAFHQQPQAGSVYPAPPAAAAKFSLSQYKPGTNTGNSTHIGVPGSYGPYGSSSTGYSPSSVVTAGNSTANEDLAASQFKESNVYVTGQQTEGSAVWITPPGQEISGLQASSFYNLPQGQVTFAPTQAGHGTFAGIYHPSQAVTPAAVHPLLQQSQTMAGAADMVGSTASVYQQPQHAQINWPNNY
ncbi:GBF-interacting protein 1-like isoform X2 [Cornus florida]|uniref:GBF-interacting protein 1-like isoform X2 n=1 Tax=Cornus florida TaxID=4283 RepID=UPI0028A2BD2C|nr:GBF-interacting protein 1-like isoform X2 [Cornus florida]